MEKIKDPEKRFEIVQLLLQKGANPRVMGYTHSTEDDKYTEINPLDVARETGDQRLVDLINAAIQKLDI
jgi:hypothetical protein